MIKIYFIAHCRDAIGKSPPPPYSDRLTGDIVLAKADDSLLLSVEVGEITITTVGIF
jgi:hypothetical protein